MYAISIKIVEWMLPHPPKYLDDKHWQKLLNISGTVKRVTYLQNIAKIMHNDEMQRLRDKALSEVLLASRDFEVRGINVSMKLVGWYFQ